MASLLRDFDRPLPQLSKAGSSGSGTGERHRQILHIESQRSQLLTETVVQFPRDPAPLLLLRRNKLGCEGADLAAVGFRKLLQPLALRDISHEGDCESHPRLIDGAQTDFEREACAVFAAAFLLPV